MRVLGATGWSDTTVRGIQFKFANVTEAAQYILATLGPRPSPVHSIDRIDNDGHYEPGNLRWATNMEQVEPGRGRPRTGRNVEIVSITLPHALIARLTAFAEKTGISRSEIIRRLLDQDLGKRR
jgi:hypothetical protein